MERVLSGVARSRRNLLKMITVAASAAVINLTNGKPAAGSACPPPSRNPFCHCFLKGTTIRTTAGDRNIEDLNEGDLLPALFGGVAPIQRIGHFTFNKTDPSEPWAQEVLPVRIARSALGPEIPRSDLCVTQAHALYFDGVLVPAIRLINGTTITLDDASELDKLEFFHIKLERHDVIYAEDAACETALNLDAIAADFTGKRGEVLTGSTARCAPFVKYEGGRSEMKSRFRSAVSPWIDRRQKFDIIRDNLEERGIVLLRQSEGWSAPA